MSLASAIYKGDVVHARMRPKKHRLKYSVFSLLIDLDELPLLDQKSRLFAHNRFAPLSFYDRDHGALEDTPLRGWVDARLREAGMEPDNGAVRLLCYPRVFGYVFNPLSVFFCHGESGELRAILYEVCNTYKERHTYVIPVEGDPDRIIRQSCDKLMYVSPFIDMQSTYHFRINPPGESVNIVIRQEDPDGLLLAASFNGRRGAFTSSVLASLLARFPFLTLKIMAGIHWEALRMWLKGFRIFSHTHAPRPVESSVGNPAPSRQPLPSE